MPDAKYQWWYCRKQPSTQPEKKRVGKVILQTGCSLAGAGLVYFKFQIVWLAGLLAGIGLFVLISGLLIPRLYAAFDKMINFLAVGVGQVLTWLLLAPFYYVCIFPARLALIMLKRDPMKRQWEPNRSTYWEEKRDHVGHNRLTRQY